MNGNRYEPVAPATPLTSSEPVAVGAAASAAAVAVALVVLHLVDADATTVTLVTGAVVAVVNAIVGFTVRARVRPVRRGR